MIKNLKVTVDGKSYDVTVEMPDESESSTITSTTCQPTQPQHAPIKRQESPAPAAPIAPVAATSGPGNVTSPLAGRVTAVMVTVGQEVKEQDHLLTLEAMKMNTFVFAPKSGKIAAISVAVGDAVHEGQAMVQVD